MSPEDRVFWHKQIHPLTPIEVAAQIWCSPACSSVEMDHRLATAFAVEIDREQQKATNWLETAHQHHANEDYYRGLLDQIGGMLGPEAYTSDDGSVQDSVLRAKLPELVRAALSKAVAPASNGEAA